MHALFSGSFSVRLGRVVLQKHQRSELFCTILMCILIFSRNVNANLTFAVNAILNFSNVWWAVDAVDDF